jgi:hypothetical protein
MVIKSAWRSYHGTNDSRVKSWKRVRKSQLFDLKHSDKLVNLTNTLKLDLLLDLEFDYRRSQSGMGVTLGDRNLFTEVA